MYFVPMIPWTPKARIALRWLSHLTINPTCVSVSCKNAKNVWQEYWFKTDQIHYAWSAFEKVSNEKLDETDMLQVIFT